MLYRRWWQSRDLLINFPQINQGGETSTWPHHARRPRDLQTQIDQQTESNGSNEAANYLEALSSTAGSDLIAICPLLATLIALSCCDAIESLDRDCDVRQNPIASPTKLMAKFEALSTVTPYRCAVVDCVGRKMTADKQYR